MSGVVAAAFSEQAPALRGNNPSCCHVTKSVEASFFRYPEAKPKDLDSSAPYGLQNDECVVPVHQKSRQDRNSRCALHQKPDRNSAQLFTTKK